MPASDERIIRLFASLNPEQKIAVVKLIETCFLDQSGGGDAGRLAATKEGLIIDPSPSHTL
jgi:hypothetical protein